MIGELREAVGQASVALAVDVPGPTEGVRCPACACLRPGNPCRVCGSPVIKVGLVVTGPLSPGGDAVAEGEVEESIVSFARKKWTESLHPRTHGMFANKPGGPIAHGPFSGMQRSSLATDRVGSAPRPKPSTQKRSSPSFAKPAVRTPRGDAPKVPSTVSQERTRRSMTGSGEAADAARRGRARGGPIRNAKPGVTGPKLSEAELPKQVGEGRWSEAAKTAVAAMQSGTGGDTDSQHRIRGGPYKPERIELHARIASLLLQGSASHPNPEAVFLAGGPASGKSTLVRNGLTRQRKDAVDVNPDIVKAMMPEFQQLVAAGDQRAAALVHEESSHIAKMVMNLAILRRHNVVVDGVGNSPGDKFAGKIRAARDAGLDVRVVYATIPTEEAVSRAEKRGKRTGRVVVEGYLRSAHSAVSDRYVDSVSKLGVPIDIYDMRNKTPELVAQHSGPEGKLTIHKRGLYDEFVGKGEIHTVRQQAEKRAAAARASRVPVGERARAAAQRIETAGLRDRAHAAGRRVEAARRRDIVRATVTGR